MIKQLWLATCSTICQSNVKEGAGTDDDGELDSIIGGSPAAPGEFLFMTSLTRNGAHFCGGTLIGPLHVLTACRSFFYVADKRLLMIDINIGGSLNVLLKASVKIRYNSICADQYGPSFIGADMMCASGPSGTGFCQWLVVDV
uniref:Peptidase S1 domain-containing protein n=1 Tax=Daphnia galeata TaxID=27404 RepID=A0A8J2RKH8_9CRUS|nr:unnamed protein product [Daphnia galeata]